MLRARTLFSLLYISSGLYLTVGCTDSYTPYQGWAKVSEQELGILAQGISQKELQSLTKDYPKTKILNLAPKHKLYEIKNVPLETLQDLFPKTQFTKNKILLRSQQQPDIQSPEEQFADFIIERNKYNPNAKSQKQIQTEEDQIISAIETCKDAFNPPQIRLDYSYPPSSLSDVYHLEKSQIYFDASDSKPPRWINGKLETYFAIIPPLGSSLQTVLRKGPLTDFTMDMVGAYSIMVWGKDKRGVCGQLVHQIFATANDPFDPKATDTLIGASLQLPDFKHMKALKTRSAWKLSKGKDIIIAVIDSGVHYNHPFINKQIWTNQNEIPDNNIDDDNNGFIDDYLGWDFSFNDNVPFDDFGHGSHVAGLAASPIMGSAPKAQIMAIKAVHYLHTDFGSVAASMYYAIDQGANIINLSLGQYYNSERLAEIDTNHVFKPIFQYAEDQNVLVVVAAGNGDTTYGEGFDVDRIFNFPADYNSDHILTVTSSSLISDNLSLYANFGRNDVDIALPGGDSKDPDTGNPVDGFTIMSLKEKNSLNFMFTTSSGTSMSTPIAAGIAAQIMELKPNWTVPQVIQHMKSVGTESLKLKGLLQSEKHLDALSALESL